MVQALKKRSVALATALIACVHGMPTSTVIAGGDPACEPAWVPTFGGERGMDATVYALQDHDDGTGEALYAGGAFTQAGLLATKGIAKWDGHQWSALEAGLHGTVYCMTIFDDGSGPALYAGGLFALAAGQFNVNVAKWNGTQWTFVGAGPTGTVYALAVYDDGSGDGASLYAGGQFSQAGSHLVNNIARWDGTEWSGLGDNIVGTNSTVRTLQVFDDGSGAGPSLYLAGNFVSTGGISAQRVARWDGASFSSVGNGLTGPVYALAVYDEGNGPSLFAGGRFSGSGSVAIQNVARLTANQQWEQVGDGLTWEAQPTVNEVRGLFAHSANGQSFLYACGGFQMSGAVTTAKVAKWDGNAWSQVGEGMGSGGRAYVFGAFDDGTGGGEEIYLGHDNLVVPASGTGSYLVGRRIVKFTNGYWQPLGGGINVEVQALHVFDDGSGGGKALYAGGRFVAVDGVEMNHVARWGGDAWEPVGQGVDGNVLALATATVDGEPGLVAGGLLGASVVGFSETYVAGWNGESWAPITSGLRNTESPGTPVINALIEFDDGSGLALYVGGNVTHAGDAPINHVARWNGKAWEPLGDGSETPVLTFCVFDDGSGGGPALHASGLFVAEDGMAESRVGKWDGTTWTPVGTGTTGSVRSLVVFDDGNGSGPTLYAAGNASLSGFNDIIKLVGTKWLTVGIVTQGTGAFGLAVYDEGTGNGPQLFACGRFTEINGLPATYVARLDGELWSPLDDVGVGSGSSSSSPHVNVLAVFDDGNGPGLCVGGDFVESPGGDSHVAMWRGCATSCLGDFVTGATFAITPDGVVDSADLGFLLNQWGANPGSPADIVMSATFAPPPDGVVDGSDLAVVLGAWGPCE
jgi:hypothetical protein